MERRVPHRFPDPLRADQRRFACACRYAAWHLFQRADDADLAPA